MAASEKKTGDHLQYVTTQVGFFSVLSGLAGQLSLGTDITRIALPSIFCYPISLLEIIAVKRMRGMDQCAEYVSIAGGTCHRAVPRRVVCPVRGVCCLLFCT